MRMTIDDTDKENSSQADSNAGNLVTEESSSSPLETNSIKDEIKQQKAKMKDRSFSEKAKYFWKYYKIHTIVAVVIILFILNIIKSVTGSKPYAFLCYSINSFGLDSQEVSQRFADYEGINTSAYDCLINTSYTLQPKLTDTYGLSTSQSVDAQIQSGTLDVMTMDTACFYQYALESYFVDLRTVLSYEEISKYEPYFYYIDMADYEKAVANSDEFGIDISRVTSLSSSDEKNAEGLTHLDPSTMTDPVPVGIIINDSQFVKETDCYSGTVAVLGILGNSQHIDTAVDFINFIWNDEIKWESVY